MSSLSGRRSYTFGPYLLDVDQRLLLRSGQKVAIRPKIFDTLRALVENNGRVLHKEE